MTDIEMQTHADPNGFIAHWRPSDGQEIANYQLVLTEPCDVLGVPQPDPAIEETRENADVFERRVNVDGTRSNGWTDLYKRGCFALEAKQSRRPERQSLLAQQDHVREILDGLVVMGQDRQVNEDRYAA